MTAFDDSPVINSWTHHDLFGTVSLHKTEDGWSSEWWASRINGIELQVAAHLEFPVWGLLESGARSRVDIVSGRVMEMIRQTSGGAALIHSEASDIQNHVLAHVLNAHTYLDVDSEIERTAILYKFAREFHIKYPVKIVAEVLGISNMRTVYDRLNTARENGIIPLAGRGKSW